MPATAAREARASAQETLFLTPNQAGLLGRPQAQVPGPGPQVPGGAPRYWGRLGSKAAGGGFVPACVSACLSHRQQMEVSSPQAPNVPGIRLVPLCFRARLLPSMASCLSLSLHTNTPTGGGLASPQCQTSGSAGNERAPRPPGASAGDGKPWQTPARPRTAGLSLEPATRPAAPAGTGATRSGNGDQAWSVLAGRRGRGGSPCRPQPRVTEARPEPRLSVPSTGPGTGTRSAAAGTSRSGACRMQMSTARRGCRSCCVRRERPAWACAQGVVGRACVCGGLLEERAARGVGDAGVRGGRVLRGCGCGC